MKIKCRKCETTYNDEVLDECPRCKWYKKFPNIRFRGKRGITNKYD
jgi:hypothetical protein